MKFGVKTDSNVKKFFYFAGPLLVLSLIAGFFVDAKLVLVVLFSLLLLDAFILYQKKIGQQLIVAFLFALAIVSYHHYEYTTFNLALGQINLFPLVAWTFGLVLLREIYERVEIDYRFLGATLSYWMGLFFVEYLGYYLLNIRLDSNFASLLGFGIIHGPIELKLFYVLAGPVYLAVTNYLGVK